MSNITLFSFDNQEIRFINGLPVANDVARVLGFKDPANAVNRLVKKSNDKGICKLQTPGGVQSVVVLKKPGIFRLIFGSKLPSAEAFQDWIFEEVLPALQEKGEYKVNKKSNKPIKSEEDIKIRQESKEVRRTLTDSIKDYIDRHPELSPNKAKFLYSNASNMLNRGILGKDAKSLKYILGISSSAILRDYLDSKEVICLKVVEYLACQLIDIKDVYPCEAINQSIEVSYSHMRFAPKYNAPVKQLVSSR